VKNEGKGKFWGAEDIDWEDLEVPGAHIKKRGDFSRSRRVVDLQRKILANF
jgi:hypothetical protein